ncbi:MAG TPA: DUF4019 domain-containing protein [Candidatus Angelobacter sp.]
MSKGNSTPVVGTVILLAALTSLSGCLSSCNAPKDIELAKEGVARFHSQFDSEQYHTIYTEADEAFRKATNEPELTALLQACHRKLGGIQNPELQNTQTKWLAGQGTFVMLSYQTRFSNATGTESFTWRIVEGRAILVGYNINSNALILK